MKLINHTIIFVLTCILLDSCGQKGNSNPIKQDPQKRTEQKYNRVISDSTNKLIDKREQLEVEYTVWGCACPNWIQTKDNQNNDTTKNYLSLHFYIEPADKSLELPTNFDAHKHKLKIKGQFYEKEDYPHGTIEMEEPMAKAKIFRYSELTILNKYD
jgi:hypothetical protein